MSPGRTPDPGVHAKAPHTRQRYMDCRIKSGNDGSERLWLNHECTAV
jgi:hypothetical protein